MSEAPEQNKTNKEQSAASYPLHDCHAWNRQHYISNPDYQAAMCGMCGRITGFRWRSMWQRIVSLWSSENQKPTRIIE